MKGKLQEVEMPPSLVVELIREAHPTAGKIAVAVERALRRIRRRRVDRRVKERIHDPILRGEAPSYGGKSQRDEP